MFEMSNEIVVEREVEKTKLELLIEKVKLVDESILRENKFENFQILSRKLFEIAEMDQMFEFQELNVEQMHQSILDIKLADRFYGKLSITIHDNTGEIMIFVLYYEGPNERTDQYVIEANNSGLATAKKMRTNSAFLPEPRTANSEFIEYLIEAILEKVSAYYE